MPPPAMVTVLQRQGGARPAAAPVEGLRRSFHAVLGDRNLKEEHVLYPGTENPFGPEEADRLVRSIQSY
jgi:hypothetical protein